MIFLSFGDEKHPTEDHRHRVCRHDRDPDAVQFEEKRQEQNSAHLKYQRPKERNDRGGQTVVESGKKSGAEDGKAHKEKRDREDAEAVDRHFKQPGTVTDENVRERAGKQFRCAKHEHTADGKNPQAFLSRLFSSS